MTEMIQPLRRALRALAVLSALLVALPVEARDDRLNVILFVSDDHRADVLGCAGHPIVRTPHIDRLAKEGVRFSGAFVTTSICAASRATLLTGAVERTHRYTFGTPPLARRFCEQSYPSLLRDVGYRTGFVGKLGVSVAGDDATIEAMFDRFVPIGRTPYRKTQPDGSLRHATDLIGDAAIDFVRSTPPDRPFCLSVSFNAGHAEDGDKSDHYPYPAAEADLHAGEPMPRPRLDGDEVFAQLPPFLRESMNRDRYFWRWDTPEKYDRNLRNYFRMLHGLDRNIGRVMAELAERGLGDRTVVIFTGDNGYYMGERGLAGKWSHYDESLRVPLVVHDPRVPAARRGRVVDGFALNADIAATILDVAGLEPPAGSAGRSLLPTINGERSLDDRDGFYCEHRMRHPRIPRWEGYRTRRFAYAHYLDVDAGGEILHDLESDPDQLVNVAEDVEYMSALAEMREACATRSRQYAAAGEPLPRVLLLGDSISMGYHEHVVAALDGEAIVIRPKENCAGTTKGVQKIDGWLALQGGGFDVIHFNFGLHDLKRVKEAGGNRNSNDPADPRQADLATYERNLREIVARLEATGATLIFATTTPFPPGVRPHRDPEDVDRYNAAALRIMEGRGIAIDDLCAFARPRLDAIQQPVNVHFSREGSRELAGEVARHVRSALRRRGAD